ncbi:MAG: hypothetical protein A3A88_09015 [Nitrospirae bacterium RIFCSPLOWO2_01_FULL_62_17]|nr:MAG: hypothetical protein A3A88_09015 [Nitrospirae bacterium RIFCSPLOWO2_01_FULL_62_17]
MLVGAAIGVCALGAAPMALAQTAKPAPLVEQMSSGSVNWTSGWVKATGIGVPPSNAGPAGKAMAQRAAFSVAVRNLLEVVKGVRIDAATLVENYMIQNDVIKSQVSGFVKGAQIEKTNESPDGSVEVLVKAPLWGVNSLYDPFLDQMGVQDQKLPPEPAEDSYTGLVIDARGLGLKPACFPAVLDDKGEVVYGPKTVDRAAAQKDGMVHYMSAPKGADLSSLFGDSAYIVRPVQTKPPAPPREGRKPLKIKGGDKAGALKANIIISSDDAKKIRDDSTLSVALKRSRVTIVTDPLIGGMEGRAPGFEHLLAAVVPDAAR